ncbi:MAG TPA: dethiobiotin synthase [Candidatus Kapabacteria bacterium]|nr:dethiobiotin synthase [Candidatus Kapabacteria bacterium]
MPGARTIFVTGTDTGVGKTAVTGLLLAHAQAEGINVRALKPFSTGGHEDEALLSSLQKSSLRINFFHFPEPVSPWSAAKIHKTAVTLDGAIQPIQEHRASCELLLVEGAGGLLTPLGERFHAADLIAELRAEVVVVAANRLGVLNHAVLTVEALRHRGVTSIRVALVDHAESDHSSKLNRSDLMDLLAEVPVVPVPYFEKYCLEADFIRAASKTMHTELSTLLQGKKNPPDTEAEGTFP